MAARPLVLEEQVRVREQKPPHYIPRKDAAAVVLRTPTRVNYVHQVEELGCL